MNMEKLKSHDRYLYYRVYFVAAVLLGNAASLWIMHNKQPIQYQFFIFPFTLPAMVMLCNLAIFPWKYSIFGTNERTPFPNEQPVFKQAISSVSIGWFSVRGLSLFTMYVFDSGLGMSFLGGAKVFIPKEDISSVKKEWLCGYQLKHNSPELRNPVSFFSKEVFEKIQNTLR